MDCRLRAEDAGDAGWRRVTRPCRAIQTLRAEEFELHLGFGGESGYFDAIRRPLESGHRELIAELEPQRLRIDGKVFKGAYAWVSVERSEAHAGHGRIVDTAGAATRQRGEEPSPRECRA
jgi:hypothetical protein